MDARDRHATPVMADLRALLAPTSIAIAGISADPTKHGQRVLSNLRRAGFAGQIWGINPRRPDIAGVEVVATVDDLPAVPDVIVSAVPASVVGELALQAGAAGVKYMIVFAGGFAEAGDDGQNHQAQLDRATAETGIRLLGPNSGGIIHPSAGIAMSFLTCLDRPAEQIRSGPVGLVTQSGGMGSYVHNLAAGIGDGLAASISTGNEADLGVADGIDALVDVDEVEAIAVILETVRRGEEFVEAVKRAHAAGKQVVATRIGRSERGRRLMATHTGALAKPERVLRGVLDELGVSVTDTPAEMFEVASIAARTPRPRGPRLGVVTHSGGMAILVSDLADSTALELPQPSDALRAAIEPLIQQGAVDNPLDMGGIIGGPHRFAEIVSAMASSDEFDAVLAVSSAHPPAHSDERVEALLEADFAVPVVNLWMAGDVGQHALETLRAANAPVTTEPRAAVAAMATLSIPLGNSAPVRVPPVDPAPSAALTEFETKQIVNGWGVPVVNGGHASTADEAVELADSMGYPVVVKVSSPDIVHKTEIGGVAFGLGDAAAVRAAFGDVQKNAPAHAHIEGVLVEQQVSGPEVIVGGVRDPSFGPMLLLGIGGVVAEALDDVRLVPAPVPAHRARSLVETLAGRRTLTHPRTGSPADLDQLAQLASTLSARFVANHWVESFDLNPVIWTNGSWVAVDAAFELAQHSPVGPDARQQTHSEVPQ